MLLLVITTIGGGAVGVQAQGVLVIVSNVVGFDGQLVVAVAVAVSGGGIGSRGYPVPPSPPGERGSIDI